MQPGAYLLEDGDIEVNIGRATARVVVRHTGDRPIQVGSHYHFFEVNRELAFERAAAYGMRLDIPAGTAVRFEPGEEKVVALVAFAGERRIYGHNGLVDGRLDDPSVHATALRRLAEYGFANTPAVSTSDGQAASGTGGMQEEGENT